MNKPEKQFCSGTYTRIYIVPDYMGETPEVATFNESLAVEMAGDRSRLFIVPVIDSPGVMADGLTCPSFMKERKQ